jgi:sugar phosphate isomerase/epimerase
MRPEIVAACWTTAGDAAPLPGLEVSPVPLEERVRLAARAGFAGLGIVHHDLVPYLADGRTLADLRRVVDDAGLRYVELEFLTGWWLPDDERAESDATMRLLLDAAEQLGAYELKVGPALDGSAYDPDRYAEHLHRVAAAFASTGTVVSLEFMPFANISTLASALDLVERADHPNVGLMLDLWHLVRSSTSMEEVGRVPLHHISAVELDDGPARAHGDGYEDTVLRRALCGEGEFPVAEFVATLRSMGWEGPWGLEILSESYRRRPVEAAVRDAYATTARYLEG